MPFPRHGLIVIKSPSPFFYHFFSSACFCCSFVVVIPSSTILQQSFVIPTSWSAFFPICPSELINHHFCRSLCHSSFASPSCAPYLNRKIFIDNYLPPLLCRPFFLAFSLSSNLWLNIFCAIFLWFLFLHASPSLVTISRRHSYCHFSALVLILIYCQGYGHYLLSWFLVAIPIEISPLHFLSQLIVAIYCDY